MTKSANDLVASGREAMQRSDWATAFELLQEAASSENLEASALEDLASAAWWSGRPDDCINAREQAYAAYTKSDEPKKAAMVAIALAEDHFHTRASALGHGWLKRAGDWSDAAKRWCERAGHSSGFPGVCRIHRAEIMRLRGDWESAEAEAQRAANEVGNFVDFAGEAFYEIGQIRMHMGDFTQAEEAFRQAHGLGRDPQPGRALLQLAQGNSESAWTLISQSLADASAPLKKARLLPAIIEVALARDDPESARAQ
ncbi:MAG: hypothetical protein V3S60_06360 [Acidimicrobiia bacterium]